MIRQIKLVLWFCLGLFLGGAATYASAETIAATQTTATKRFFSNVGAGQFFVSSATAYNEVCSKFFNGQGIVQGGSMTSNADGSSFVCGYWNNGTWVSGGQTQGISSAWFCGDTVSSQGATCGYTCPSGQNWTLSGANCTRPDCSAGQIRDPATGRCIIDCGSSAAKANVGRWFEGSGGSPSSLCVQGCSYSASFCLGTDSGYACKAGGVGGNCSGAGVSQASAAAAACAEQGQKTGTVNGITVCAGPASSTSSSSSSSSSTSSGGATTGATTSSQTTCADGKCTTTTTTTTTSGGQTTLSTTTTEQGKGDFCAANPRNPQCIGAEQEDICAKFPDRIECKDLGTPSEGAEPVGSKTIGVSAVTPVQLATNMSCPPDVVLPKGYGTITMGPACDFAGWVRPLVLAFAWLSAGLIVIGGVRT